MMSAGPAIVEPSRTGMPRPAGACPHSPAFTHTPAFLQATAFLGAPLIGIFAGLRFMPSAADEWLWCLCWLQTLTWGWILWSWRTLHGRWFDAYSIFATVFFLFMGGGSSLAIVLGGDVGDFLREDHYIAYERFHREVVAEAMLLATAALACLHFAALAGSCWNRSRPARHDPLASRALNRGLRQIGWALIAVSTIPAATTIFQGMRLVTQGGYMALFVNPTGQSEADYNYFAMLASGLTPGALIVLATAGPRDRYSVRLAWFLIVAVSASSLALGTRAAAYQNAIALLWLHHHCVRQIRGSRMLVLIPLGATIASLVRLSRSYAGESLMSFSTLLQASGDLRTGVTDFLHELGSSAITVVYTLNLVPSERAHGWGDSYFYALLSAVPNLFWDVHPSVAHGFLGQWLIEVVSPAVAAAGGGLGFSLLAEWYYNFGWIGTLLAAGVLGWLLGRFVRWVHVQPDAFRLATAAILINILPFASRADSLYCVRRLIYLALIPYLLSRILARYAVRDSQPTRPKVFGPMPVKCGGRR